MTVLIHYSILYSTIALKLQLEGVASWGTSTLTWATMDKPGGERAEEKRLVGYEPEWCFVIGLQCWSLIGPNEHHV